MNPIITVQGEDFRAAVLAADEQDVEPAHFGVPDPCARWLGSRVRLKPAVEAKMALTRVFDPQPGIPRNAAASRGTLALSLVLPVNPAPGAQFIITGLRVTRVSLMYDCSLRSMAHCAPNRMLVFELALALPEGHELDSPLPNPYALLVPCDAVDILEFGQADARMPEPGRDYVAPRWVVLQHRYRQVDQRCEGFSNRPTAALAKALYACPKARTLVDALRAEHGGLTEAPMRELCRSQGWENEFVCKQDYLTPGFPEHFRELVQFGEIAASFNP